MGPGRFISVRDTFFTLSVEKDQSNRYNMTVLICELTRLSMYLGRRALANGIFIRKLGHT
jgi:hypothetical protein